MAEVASCTQRTLIEDGLVAEDAPAWRLPSFLISLSYLMGGEKLGE